MAQSTEQPLTFQRAIQPDFLAVRDVLEEIAQWMAQHTPCTGQIGNTQLVLAEVLNNVVEHSGLHSGQAIEIEVMLLDDSVVCRIRDQGPPFQGFEQARKAHCLQSHETADLPEGGFGLMLIQTLTSDIRYLPVNAGNHLQVTVPFVPEPVQIY